METKPLTLRHVIATVQKAFDTVVSDRLFRCVADVIKMQRHKWTWYCEMCEYSSQGSIVAKAKLRIPHQMMIDFCTAIGFDTPASLVGSQILFYASATFHDEYGFSLHCHALNHHFVTAKREDAKQRLRQELRELWYHNRRFRLTKVPCHFAIISSQTSQGLHDFLTILDDRQLRYSYQAFWSPIHGNEAREWVYEACKKIYLHLKAHPYAFDAIVIVRWGGGTSGISWQNDPRIVRAVCHLPCPVMLAVWHTSDVSLLDEIVAYPLKTPSDAWHLICDLYERTLAIVYGHVDDCARCATLRYVQGMQVLEQLCLDITMLYQRALQQYEDHIVALCQSIALYDPSWYFSQGWVAAMDENGKRLHWLPQGQDPFWLYDGMSWVHVTQWTVYSSMPRN